MLNTLHVVIYNCDFISKYKYIDFEMKKYYVPYTLPPQYTKECTELIFYSPYVSLNEITFKLNEIIFQNYYISNNRTPTPL